ncbi:MAG TPA: hypothetical protein VK324_13145 [Tepidisphaeraceae bacterium]|nr:hypothetical protein [Tepidisphaeraceae bacterium]
MFKTVEATIDPQGIVTLAEPVRLRAARRALVTILDEDELPDEAAILSESALSEDWLDPQEDEAWKHLGQLPDLDKDDGRGST